MSMVQSDDIVSIIKINLKSEFLVHTALNTRNSYFNWFGMVFLFAAWSNFNSNVKYL